MAEFELNAYREEILLLKGAGHTQAEVIRALKDRYGVEVKRSTLSDYWKTLPPGATATMANGATSSAAVALTEDVRTAAVMHGAREEILDRLAQVIEGLQHLKHEGDARHDAVLHALKAFEVSDTLERHSRAFETLYNTFKGAVLAKIWRRALRVTGLLWGIGVAGWYVGSHPVYAAKLGHVWRLLVSFLP